MQGWKIGGKDVLVSVLDVTGHGGEAKEGRVGEPDAVNVEAV